MKHLCTLLVLQILSLVALAGDPPSLSRADAKQLLEVMEWREPVIITIRQGVSAKGEVAPVYATIVAFVTRDSRTHLVNQTVQHDGEYGWFHYEIGEKVARLWTKEGFRELRPITPTLLNHRVPNP